MITKRVQVQSRRGSSKFRPKCPWEKTEVEMENLRTKLPHTEGGQGRSAPRWQEEVSWVARVSEMGGSPHTPE